mgnify:FL=1
MKQIVKTCLFLFMFMGVSGVSLADEKANETKQGTIRGRIVDASKQILPGASVYIEKLHTGVTSDVNGFYTFSNLDPGTYTVKVTYVGYTPVEMKITVPEGKTLDKDVVLNEGVELQEVVVGGAFHGQRRALSSQKNSLGVTNVVSADQVGKFPDSNIGDALKRISGINVQYDQGEARFGQVRGTSADLSSVTINGNRVPSAEGETRSVQLDLIPSDMIQTIEVNKVVTPDMDADAIGGSINLVTKNSPYKRTIAATAGTGYNWVSGKAALNLGFTYGDRFFNDKLGLMVSASYQNNPAGSDDVEMAYEKNDNGDVVLDEYEVRQYYVTRERQSYSLALDWEINANHRIDFKGIFNNRNDWENRYRHTYKWDDETPNEYEVIYETKSGGPDQRYARLERQRTMDFTLGGEHLFGKLKMDWKASYAQAGEERPHERYLAFKKEGIAMNTDWSDIRRPYMSPADGQDILLNATNSNEFELDELTEQFEDIKEKDLKFSLNFELPLAKGRYANKLKFGAKVVDKDKNKWIDFYEYKPTDEDAFLTDALGHLQNEDRDGYMGGDRYKVGNFVEKEYVGDLNLTDANSFEQETKYDKMCENFEAHETVSAGYLRFDQQLGKKWNLMAGLRLENTHVTYSGYIYDDGKESDKDESFTKTSERSKSYLNVLPSVLLKYDASEDFKIRASFTNTLARPKYANLVPNVIIDKEDIAFGNPELNPTLSYNFDLSAEYYFKSVGLVSAGLFYKKINDFIVDYRQNDYEYKGVTYEEMKQPRNAGDADLFGVEIAYQRDFGFIAPALKCIGFYGNYTYTYSKVKNFNFEGRENEDLRMPGSPEHTANASLYFDKAGFNVRLSYNFASDFIDEVGEEAFYDRYYDKVNYLDLNASYTFGKKLKTTFYAEATNLLNQPLRYYQGTPDRSMQAEYYGVRVNAGFKINF